MPKKLALIFVMAAVLNFLWEEAHCFLYASYAGSEMTQLILLRAALFDAAVITVFSYPFLRYVRYQRKHWLLCIALTAFAIGLEKWALSTGRWAYTDAMPLIPYLWVGLTPTLQLGLTGFVSFHIGIKGAE